jgi:hypothetical protein
VVFWSFAHLVECKAAVCAYTEKTGCSNAFRSAVGLRSSVAVKRDLGCLSQQALQNGRVMLSVLSLASNAIVRLSWSRRNLVLSSNREFG